MKILAWLERRRVRREFGKHVSPAVIRSIEKSRNRGELPGKPETRHFQFIVVHIQDSQPDEIAPVVAKVVDACLRHHAVISNLSASLIVACLGGPFPEFDSAEGRLSLVTALVTEAGNRIRIAHGHCDGLLGNFGSEKRWTYEAVVPGFSGILGQLLGRPFGTAVEIVCE